MLVLLIVFKVKFFQHKARIKIIGRIDPIVYLEAIKEVLTTNTEKNISKTQYFVIKN